MSEHNREQFTHLAVTRRVIDSGNFLDKVRYHTDDIFGFDIPAVVTEPGTIDEDGSGFVGDEILVVQGVQRARAEVYEEADLEISLLDRRLPADRKQKSGFGWAAGRLLANGLRVHRPIKKDGNVIPEDQRHLPVFRTSGLYSLLEQAGLRYDIMPNEQESLRLVLDGIEVSNDPTVQADGLELALTPSVSDRVTRMLVDQSHICFRGLASHSKKASYPAGPTPLNIPFVRLPADATDRDIDKLSSAVKDLLPVNFYIGGATTKTGQPQPRRIDTLVKKPR